MSLASEGNGDGKVLYRLSYIHQTAPTTTTSLVSVAMPFPHVVFSIGQHLGYRSSVPNDLPWRW